ncbi:TetR/AcrR family transcriptional regulator [Saccharopolyspora indica]|uniref:TetR/AcrR family transcriptional regulator n=1 Tax=Saccharopolyspora indica TaxID=1229659 RepID=UPI0022EAE1B5|nr:TetR/AcrR family transcriptional regulator [Saccharopolyspora indica]MDA3649145.1 TetR/AcrR family transcriptional regulator [Saccharopolyspora indica]
MPKQHRAQLTRRAILTAAATEFDLVGYEAAALNAILRRSGTTKGAFYFHFSSKAAVAEALVADYVAGLAELRRDWLEGGRDPLSTAVGLTIEVARRLERDVVLRAGLLLACRRVGAVSDGWDGLIDRLLHESAEADQLRPGADPAAVARVAYAALVGAHTVGPDFTGLAERVAETWRVVLAGVAREGALRLENTD